MTPHPPAQFLPLRDSKGRIMEVEGQDGPKPIQNAHPPAQAHTLWRVGFHDGSGPTHIVTGYELTERTVAKVRWGCSCCEAFGDPTPEQIATAQTIVTAVNSHAGLVSALQIIARDPCHCTEAQRARHEECSTCFARITLHDAALQPLTPHEKQA